MTFRKRVYKEIIKSKDFADIMKVKILSLSVTFVYEFDKYRSILNNLLILQSWAL